MKLTQSLALFFYYYYDKAFDPGFGKKKGTKTSHHGLDIVGYRRATYS
jgi:hypothetical protein